MKNIKVADMPFSQSLKNILIYYGKIFDLNDLLSRDYLEIKSLKAITDRDIWLIKDYVHRLDCTLLNEFLSLEDRKNIYRKEGKQVLEDLNIPSNVYSCFYSVGLYTLEDVNRVLVNKNYPCAIKWVSEYKLYEF